MKDKRKYKVGDLVRVYGLELYYFYNYVKDGTIGIVVEVLSFDETLNFFYFDYKVLINNEEYYVFEEEMQHFYNPNACEACECDPCDCNWGIE